jgi:hypothetical protein
MLQELQLLTIQARSAALVSKLAVVWKDVIELLHTCEDGAIVGFLTQAQVQTRSGACVPALWNAVALHLLHCSLFQHNSFLAEDLEEAAEDLPLHPYVDSNVKAAVAQFDYSAGPSSRQPGGVPRDEDAEDGNPVLELLKTTSACIVSAGRALSLSLLLCCARHAS